ncbi:MAG: GTPase ObgE [Desulfobacteraceae bacterium IS3]|nr:MAG: GTPase ObgE [Desulfobacteraceae bacterium IS3]
MKFIDEATITVRAGNGGKGCVSFRRERYIPKGGPDGGDGGKGGDVILTATSRKRTLQHFQFKRDFKAGNGRGGLGQQKTGRGGDDLIIEVPPGTLVRNADTGEILKDLKESGENYQIAKGGRGGQGNKRFATSVNRTPRFAQPGEPGDILTLELELKLLADVGIIGLPNAGKSTLISAVSSAKPKVADYPFTTLNPTLGVVKTGWGEPFVMADIPGLIKGAASGAGLGTRFLRHIERSGILLHLIDASAIDPDDPLCGYETINRELALYNETLSEKTQIVVLNKSDIPGAEEGAERFRSAAPDIKVQTISAMTGTGIAELLSLIVRSLGRDDN